MKKEPWQIVAARYCLDNAEAGFSGYIEIKAHLTKQGYLLENYQVQQFFEEEIQRPTGRQHNRIAFVNRDSSEQKWQPPFDLIQKVIDYDELKFARESAEKASRYSAAAIIIALITLIITIFISIFYVQTVRVENMPRILQTSYFVAQ